MAGVLTDQDLQLNSLLLQFPLLHQESKEHHVIRAFSFPWFGLHWYQKPEAISHCNGKFFWLDILEICQKHRGMEDLNPLKPAEHAQGIAAGVQQPARQLPSSSLRAESSQRSLEPQSQAAFAANLSKPNCSVALMRHASFNHCLHQILP